MTYDPIVKNGLFHVSCGTFSRKFRGCDDANAKWKFEQAFKKAHPGKLPVGIVLVILEPVLRVSDTKR